jgi:NAD(P)-dependent dehydrogenase (short-subunit alcohol dehydrogenase family)
MFNRFTGGDAEAKAGFVAHVPANRTATPEEIAQTILFVASAKAPYIIGTSIDVDGGFLAS